MNDEINENRWPQDEDKKRTNNSLKAVGFNLLALIVYTVLCKVANSIGSLVFEAFLVGAQVFICIVVSIARKDAVWLLSAFLVLAIGFSTCVYAGDFRL